MSRRLVAVLFLDLVGWTELAERLDPEPLQEFLERYYEICVTAVEQHGGIVEKFIGDAIMAVFGAERSQEDDALRALRTGYQTSAAIGGLKVAGFNDRPPQIHCGIAAGEALVTRSARAGIRIVGDVVNLAARLQSAAGPGEVLINEVMARLVRTQVALAPMEPLKLKGKQELVAAWRATELTPALSEGHAGVRLVDRQAERARLLDAFRRVVSTRRLHVVNVQGAPGVGKSRLVREAVRQFGAEHPTVTTAAGACPSYGATSSYQPLAQILKTLRTDDLERDVSEQQGRRVLDVLSRLPAGSAGEGDDSDVTGAAPSPGVEEIFWAARQFLATAAARPLVLVWEDLQWAGPSLLELIGALTAGLRDHPVLMINVTRPELRTSWAVRPQELDVGPLAGPDAVELVSSLAARVESAEVTAHSMDLLERIADDSGGNPLFAELMIETLALGHPPGAMPPSVTALVGAMLDRLPGPAREILEAASVVGVTFTLEQVARLDPDLTPESVTALVKRQLIRPTDRPDEFRFTQQLVHEVVYGRLEKQQRLGWHRRLAEQDVVSGFHLEVAVRLLWELRPDDPDLGSLERRAADALLNEGTHALRRRDVPTAIGLLERACDIAPRDGGVQQALAAIRLSDALLLSGETNRAATVVAAVADGSLSPRASRACRMQQTLIAVRSGQIADVPIDEMAAELAQDQEDQVSWCRFHQIQMLLNLSEGRFAAAEDAVRSALMRGRAMGDAYEEDRLLSAACEIGQWSPGLIQDKLSTCTELCRRFAEDRFLLVPVLTAKARFLALTGDLAAAREVLTEAGQIVTELHLTMGEILVEQVSGLVDSLADKPAEAQGHFLRASEALTTAGNRTVALTMRVLALRERTRLVPISEVAGEVEELTAERGQMDLRAQVLYTALAARVTAGAAGGDPTDLIAEARRLIDSTDDPCLRGDAGVELAYAYGHHGDVTGAQAMIDAALASYSTAGATLLISRIHACW